MTCGMERYANIADSLHSSIRAGVDDGIVSEPFAEKRQAARLDQIPARPHARVIGVRVRDNRAFDGLPWIDVKPARLTVQPAIGEGEQVRGWRLARPRPHGRR